MAKYQGINPLVNNSKNYYLYDIDAINASYFNLLSNEPGEVIFEPQIGFGLLSALFQPNDNRLKEYFQKKLELYLNQNETRARVSYVRVTFSGDSATIDIYWTPLNPDLRDNQLFKASFSMS